jgi:hypothetical protein
MKTTGIILIAIQVFAYVSGNIKIPEGRPASATIGYFLGSNIFAIIGIVFIIQANNKEKKNQKK